MILIGGENIMDMIQTGIQNDNMLFESVPGGSPYNVALAIGRQKTKVGYITPISQDKNGDRLFTRLVQSNVEVLSERVGAPTSLAIVNFKNGGPSYVFYRNKTAERLVKVDQLKKHLKKNIKIFHIGSLGLIGGTDAESWEDLAKLCVKRGIKISLDPNVRASLISDPDSYRSRIKRFMKITDILKLSDEDLNWLYEGQTEEASLSEILAVTSAKIIVLTRGKNGCSIWHDNNWYDHPAQTVAELKDTVGAGDTFMASLLVGISQNQYDNKLDTLDIAQKKALLVYASKAASLNCEQRGCNPPWAKDLV